MSILKSFRNIQSSKLGTILGRIITVIFLLGALISIFAQVFGTSGKHW